MEREISIKLQSNIVYVTGIVNGNEVTFTLSGDNTWTATVPRVSPDIYVCIISATNSLGTVSTINTTLYYGLQLITERTQADVEYAKSLHEKGLSRMTAEELVEWANGLKGWYDYRDLNRVGEAMIYIRDRLKAVGEVVDIEPRTDWSLSDLPTYGAITEYLNNIEKLRSVMPVPIETPVSGLLLSYEEANDIERILEYLEILIDKIEQTYLYSGEIYAGEV